MTRTLTSALVSRASTTARAGRRSSTTTSVTARLGSLGPTARLTWMNVARGPAKMEGYVSILLMASSVSALKEPQVRHVDKHL